METEHIGDALKKLTFRQLVPELRQEVLELAAEMGYEETVTSRSSLEFLFRIYKAEEVKKRRSREQLKKAERLILKLNSFQHAIQKREERRREKRKRPKLRLVEGGVMASEKTRELLARIGITDEESIEQAEALFGEEKIESRVELALSIDVDHNVIKKLFGAYPGVFLLPREDDFISELDAIENKRQLIHEWSVTNGSAPPSWADYNETPGILIDSYQDISRLLELEEPVESDIRELKYRGKPMKPQDFKKVMLAMDFEEVRESKHGTLLRRGDSIMCVQRAHKKQMMLNQSTIKKKLQENGVDLGEFEGKRTELGL